MLVADDALLHIDSARFETSADSGYCKSSKFLHGVRTIPQHGLDLQTCHTRDPLPSELLLLRQSSRFLP